MNKNLAGKFIVLDGPDGCGKSTQSKLLTDWLKSSGVETLQFRDPGATAIGEKIRNILLNPEHVAMSVRSELLLYMAARAQLWDECIKPALLKGNCVILDRWLSSTCAYQGSAGGLGVENVIRLAECSLERIWPDLTIILDIPVETAIKRINRTLDRMEQKGGQYHQKVRDGFLDLAKKYKNIVVIDADADVETVHKNILEIIAKAFQ